METADSPDVLVLTFDSQALLSKVVAQCSVDQIVTALLDHDDADAISIALTAAVIEARADAAEERKRLQREATQRHQERVRQTLAADSHVVTFDQAIPSGEGDHAETVRLMRAARQTAKATNRARTLIIIDGMRSGRWPDQTDPNKEEK